MALVSLEEWQTLEPLLDAALDVEGTARVAYLDSVSTGDPELRARLEELLVACERGERLLLTPAESFAPLLRVPEVLGGRYTIVRELGHGGMATVYLADDPKHRRQVAVKVLDVGGSQVFGDARFQQEIEIAARLQHPHILPLFDSGDADGLHYYVMPYVEGESLRDRLLREKQIPVEDAIRTASEVAEALDFAHRHGVVHRDIKPENILLHDGRAIVADFGIALALRAAAGERPGDAGLLLGTPHYMSPEQATPGTPVTSQSDIYSLGVVLYEMLAGGLPHGGDTPQEVIARIIAEPVPAVTARRKTVPPNVSAAVAKATELLPADRFARAQDFARALADSEFRHGEPRVAANAAPRRWNRLTITFAALAVVAATIAVILEMKSPALRQLGRFDITPGEGRSLLPGISGVEFTLSADGSRIVYVGEAPSGGSQLWQRVFADQDATPITGTAGAVAPALSPDGRLVAFCVGREVRTVPVRGGPRLTIVSNGRTPVWGSADLLYFARDSIIYRVAATGGAPTAVTSRTEGIQDFPDALPDRRGLLLTVRRGRPSESRIAVVGPDGGKIRELLAGTMARYASSGHIVYATESGTLMSVPFELRRLTVTGPSAPLFEGVKIKIGSASQFALSAAGPLVYQTLAADQSELVWVSRAGGIEPVDPSWTGAFSSPSLSPDGTQLAVTLRARQSVDVWVKRLDRGPSTMLTIEGKTSSGATWTPEGRSVTFATDTAGTNSSWAVWTARADGSAQPVPLGVRGSDPRWSPDGKWLVFRRGFMEGEDILGLRIGQDSVPVPLVATAFGDHSPAISRDGRWLAYTSNETGRTEVYVRPFPNTGDAKWVVSTSGGTEPVWSHSGRELFYRNGQRQMMATMIETVPTLLVGRSSVLFPDPGFVSSLQRAQYDVSPDDQHFIMIRQRRGDANGALILVLNWLDDLQRRAPR